MKTQMDYNKANADAIEEIKIDIIILGDRLAKVENKIFIETRNRGKQIVDNIVETKEDIPIETLEKMARDTDLLLSDNLINFARLVQNKS